MTTTPTRYPDFDKIAEAVRQAMIKRLSPDDGGARFAIVCLRALARDDKLADLLFDNRASTAESG